MRAVFVLTTIGTALALGVFAATSGSRLLIGALVIAFVLGLGGLSHLLERLIGRGLWHFRAPYPYRWMREEDLPATVPAGTVRQPVQDTSDTDGDSTMPLAA